MNLTALRTAYRSFSQFHENDRLIAWLSGQPWVIWLTPERRKSMLFFGAIVAGLAGIFSRNAQWRDYRALAPWASESRRGAHPGGAAGQRCIHPWA